MVLVIVLIVVARLVFGELIDIVSLEEVVVVVAGASVVEVVVVTGASVVDVVVVVGASDVEDVVVDTTAVIPL